MEARGNEPAAGRPVLVTGGTGTLGRRVVRHLRDAGRDVRVLSRSAREPGEGAGEGVEYARGDLAADEGTGPALDGVDTVVHCASARKGDAAATRNLVRAAEQAGAPHLVYISIVGVDRLSFGYFRAKLEAERVVTESKLPWTLLRATQFYDMILDGARKSAWVPVVPVPSGFRVRPMDPDDVAARLAALALGEPAGRVPDIGGPHETDAADMIRAYLRARRLRRPVVPVRMPGTRKIRAGCLLPEQTGSEQTAGRRTWEEFLAERVG